MDTVIDVCTEKKKHMKLHTATSVVLSVLILSSLSLMSLVDASDDYWTTKTPLPIAMGTNAAAVVDGQIYVFGPDAEGHILTYKYDPSKDTCEAKASMPTSRRWFGLATYENKIYAIGGTLSYNANSGNSLLTGANEMYDPATDTWTQKTSMPTPRTQLQANTVLGKIYLIGGLKSNLPTPSLTDITEIYNPSTDSWSEGKPIPIATASYASTALNGKIYILAGSLDNGQGFGYANQIYDAATDSWGSGERLPITTLQAAAASTNEPNARIYVIGGRLSGPINATQIYNPATDNWTYGAAFPTTHDYVTEYLTAASLNGKIYVFGGIAHANEGFFEITEQYTPTSNSPPHSNAVPEFLVWAIPLLIAAGTVIVVLYLKRQKLSLFLGLSKTAN